LRKTAGGGKSWSAFLYEAWIASLSHFHIRAAEIAKDNALKIHNSDAGKEEWIDYISFSASSIIMSVAALEAGINEQIEAFSGLCEPLKGASQKKEELAMLARRTGIASKYRDFPKKMKADKEIIDKAQQLGERYSIDKIVLVRNELVHYNPKRFIRTTENEVTTSTCNSKNIDEILRFYDKEKQFKFQGKFFKDGVTHDIHRIMNAEFAEWFFNNMQEFIGKYRKEVSDPIRFNNKCFSQ
jgi:hypothetical protein